MLEKYEGGNVPWLIPLKTIEFALQRDAPSPRLDSLILLRDKVKYIADKKKERGIDQREIFQSRRINNARNV